MCIEMVFKTNWFQPLEGAVSLQNGVAWNELALCTLTMVKLSKIRRPFVRKQQQDQ